MGSMETAAMISAGMRREDILKGDGMGLGMGRLFLALKVFIGKNGDGIERVGWRIV
jgi:hypothetical protein